MKTKYYLLAVAASAMLTACNSDDELKFDGKIRLTTTGMEMMTRSTNQNIQREQFDGSETVDIYLEDAYTGTDQQKSTYPQPLGYTADGGGNLSYSPIQIWPINNHSLNVWGVYPQGAGGTDVAATAVSFSVQADQSTDAGYKQSDLMTGRPATLPVEPSENAYTIPLTFHHLLAKVNVNLSKTAATTTVTDEQLASAKIYIMNTKPTTTFSPKTDDITAATGDAQDIFVCNGTSGSCIVVPQNIAAGTAYIKVVIGDDTYIYTAPDGGISLSTKKEHTYDIKIHKASVILTTTIVDWLGINDAHTTGTAYIQNQ